MQNNLDLRKAPCTPGPFWRAIPVVSSLDVVTTTPLSEITGSLPSERPRRTAILRKSNKLIHSVNKIQPDSFPDKTWISKLKIFESRIFNNSKTVSTDTVLEFCRLWAKKGNFEAKAYLGRSLIFVVTLAGSLVAVSGYSLVYATGRIGYASPKLMAYSNHSWFAVGPAKNLTVPLVAFIAVASGILIISGAGFLYFKYIRNSPPQPVNKQQYTAAGYVNNGLYAPQDEAVIVKPTIAAAAAPGQYPFVNQTAQVQQASDIPHLSAADAIAQVVLNKLAQPKPVLQYDQSAPPLNAMPVYNRIFDTPQHNVPAWQNQLKVNQAAKSDAPKDMFEIAKEHPDTFGSTQIYQSRYPESLPADKANNE